MEAAAAPPEQERQQRQQQRDSELRRLYSMRREQLCLSKQPVKTLKYFLLAVLQYLSKLLAYASRHKLTFLAFAALFAGAWQFLGYDQLAEQSWSYFRFALWWMGLGVASSIGLGSGLHTFVLYLGPHIAMLTLKATLCGREDLKLAAYDTPQFGMSSSWADKDCDSFGHPKYPRLLPDGEQYVVPFLRILLQVQPEAVLWGIGTALGELPPYFVSRAARLSGERLNELDEIVEPPESGAQESLAKRIKQWVAARVVGWIQRFGFLTILVCASIPNPLFDLAGIMCGHFLVPFWKFFLATLVGKALVKTHIQTMFIILVCNPHYLELILELLGTALSRLPTLAFVLPKIRQALHDKQEAFRHGHHGHARRGGRTDALALAWNTIVTVVLLGFLASIVTSTARAFLLEEQLRQHQQQQAKLSLSSSDEVAQAEAEQDESMNNK